MVCSSCLDILTFPPLIFLIVFRPFLCKTWQNYVNQSLPCCRRYENNVYWPLAHFRPYLLNIKFSLSNFKMTHVIQILKENSISLRYWPAGFCLWGTKDDFAHQKLDFPPRPSADSLNENILKEKSSLEKSRVTQKNGFWKELEITKIETDGILDF